MRARALSPEEPWTFRRALVAALLETRETAAAGLDVADALLRDAATPAGERIALVEEIRRAPVDQDEFGSRISDILRRVLRDDPNVRVREHVRTGLGD
jgi:hypothetical protein